MSNNAQRTQEIKSIMSQLSLVHHDVLGYVIFHLKKVAEKESKNLVWAKLLFIMHSTNISNPLLDEHTESGCRFCTNINVA